MLCIIHITDLHFGKPSLEVFPDKTKLRESIVATVRDKLAAATEVLLVVSGDLVYQCSPYSYHQAVDFIAQLRDALKVSKQNLFLCIGNHDLNTKALANPFSDVKQAITKLTGASVPDHDYIRRTDEAEVLVLNSVHHRNKDFGLVDVKNLPAFTTDDVLRVVVVHHNLINVYPDDCSTIRNAFGVLAQLDKSKAGLVLHGHQHLLADLAFGQNRCRVVGAGSLNFVSEASVGSQFNLVVCDNGELEVTRYIWVPDRKTPDGKLGAWDPSRSH